MALVEKDQLISRISPPLDNFLATQLLDEFIACERRFILGDWEPAELNGGQFCEILARIVYHQDSGNLNKSKAFDDCLKYVETDGNNHVMQPRHNALHLCVVLRNVYKFRSQRGAVHISPHYEANHLDARFVMEAVRWAMNETLRIFWNSDREAVAKVIRELLQFDVPCVGKFSDVLLVQRTDLTAEEEVLVLLHYAGEIGLSRRELGQQCMASAPSVTNSIKKLASPSMRQIVLLGSGSYRLTDLGQKRIRESLGAKLLLQ